MDILILVSNILKIQLIEFDRFFGKHCFFSPNNTLSNFIRGFKIYISSAATL